MDVYGEYLFVENFMAGYGIIRLTGMMCGRHPSRARNICGSVMCGIFAFILFVNIPRAAAAAAGILFSACTVYVVFMPKGIGSALRITAVFYISSFLLGGAAIAAVCASGCGGVVSSGILYIGNEVYLLMAAGAVSVSAMGVFAVKFIRKAAVRAGEIVKVNIDVMGKNITCMGKLDTANYLREPLSGKPVSIIEKAAAESAWGMLYRNHMLDNRIRLIPYSSMGCDDGMIAAMRCDNMIIDRGDIFGRGRIYLRNTYIGIYDGVFSGGCDEEKYSVLLQPELIGEECCAK